MQPELTAAVWSPKCRCCDARASITEVARVRAGPATKARGRKRPTRARSVASPVDPVSYPPPHPLLLLLLFQTEHARGDGTCARRGAYSAAKPEARARGAGLGRVVGAQQRGHVPDLGLVLGVRLRGRVRAVARRAASPRAARVRAQAPGARARARCAAPPAGGGPRGRGAPAIFKALSQAG